MENQLFRKKSMERISSPEELHDYLRVTSPKLWMILGAIIILLAGFVVYASVANLENTASIRVNAESFDTVEEVDGKEVTKRVTYFYGTIPLSMKDSVTTGTVVRIGDATGRVSMMTIMSEGKDEEQVISIVIDMDDPAFTLRSGEYDAELVIDARTPISFLWN